MVLNCCVSLRLLVMFKLLLLCSLVAMSFSTECIRRPNLHYPEPYNVFDYTGSTTKEKVCAFCCDKNPGRWDEKWTVQHKYTKRVYYCQCDDLNKKLEECRKPTGDNCQWYYSCLNRYATKPAAFNTKGNYALGYGFRYCQRFGDNLANFSPQGQEWIANTRKCLQEKLAPYVGTNKSNEEIKEIAFESHTRCYVDNGLCELPPGDWKVIVTTVGDALLSEILKTGGNVIQTSAECTGRVAARVVGWGIDKAKAVIDTGKDVIDTGKQVVDVVSAGVDAVRATMRKYNELKKVFFNDMLPTIG